MLGPRSRFLVAALLVAGVACSSAGSPEPRTSAGSIPNEQVSTDDALPKVFPSEFPLPPGYHVLYSAVSPNGSIVYFSSELDTPALRQRLLADLKEKGWKLHVCTTLREGLTTLVVSKEARVASVVVGYSEDLAQRLEGKRYSFFVSIAANAPIPQSTADHC